MPLNSILSSKVAKFVAQLITNDLKHVQSLLLVAYCSGGIFNAPMDSLSLAGKHRTLLIRVIADRDNLVEILSNEFINRF